MRHFDFLKLIDERIEAKKDNIVQFATVSPTYAGGRPSLIFDGETTETSKTYNYNPDLTLSANDEVLLIKGFIVCKISRV